MKMALLISSTPTPTSLSPHTLHHFNHKSHHLNLNLNNNNNNNKHNKKHFLVVRATSSDNGAGSSSAVNSSSTAVVVVAVETAKMETSEETSVGPIESVDKAAAAVGVNKFKDVRWVNGTWDLQQFNKNGSTDWDAVIDAEAKRRKRLETYPESTNNNEPIIFDTSIIPWWAWIKRFHLPEAELLNGRAAMIGFFMSYFVDSLTGLGVVDQMSNFFCKTLLFVSVLGVLFIRKNEDVDNLKKLFEETTFYDKQWQATWQEETKKD